MENHQSENAYNNALTSMVSSLVAQASVMNMQRNFSNQGNTIENTYLIGNRLGHMAGNSVAQVERRQVVEESQKNLDDLQRSIEQAAANSASGENTSPSAAQNATGTTTAKAAPAPEAVATGTGSVPSSEARPAPTPQAAPPSPPQVSVAVSAYSASGTAKAPSIKISV